MGTARRLVQRRHKLNDDVKNNVPSRERADKRDEILNDSPGAFGLKRGIQRRLDSDFGKDMLDPKRELAWEANVSIARADAAGAVASGSIQAVAKADLVDEEEFVLDDGVNAPTTFQFDVAGDGVTGGTAVDVSGATTAADVAAIMETAINGVGAGLAITATDAGSGLVTLVNDAIGIAGNEAITETVVDAAFVATGMVGGVASDFGLVLTLPSSSDVSARGIKAGDQLTILEQGSALERAQFKAVEEANTGDVTAGEVRIVSATAWRLPDDSGWSSESNDQIRVEISAGARK